MKQRIHRSALYKIILLAVLIISVQNAYSLSKNDSTFLLSEYNNAVMPYSSMQNDSVPEEITKDYINETISYDWADSTIFDAQNQIMYLYGDAHVVYDGMELSAEYIEYNFNSNIATAKGLADSSGVIVGKPVFRTDGQEVFQDSLIFNMSTKTGLSRKVVTSDGDANILSEVSKIHSNKWVHLKNGKFTTCDAENPHFHFHLTKAIVIPNEKIVTGPVYLKFRKVPTPLALPFGFFPNKKESTHGILIPRFGNDQNLGFFFRDLGYYYPFNDNWDSKMLFDVYTRGSWTAKNRTRYKTRYKNSGSFDISRTVTKQGLAELPSFTKESSFFVKWIHRQDSKAKPNTSFNADVDFGSTDNFRNTLSSSQEQFLQGTFNSSINWTKSFEGFGKNLGIPFNFSVQARETQNAITRNFRITLPSISLSSGSSFAKFVNKNKRNSSKFYNKLKYTYNTNFDNFLDAEESELSLNNIRNLADKTQNGVKHSLSITTNTKIFKDLVSVTPRINMTEYWSFKSYEESLFGDDVIKDTIGGFQRTGDWNAGFSMTTKFYGMFRFKNAKNISAIRHVLTPSLTFNYAPENDRRVSYGFDVNGNELLYNPWQLAAFTANDINERGTVTLNLQNNLEMKVRDKSSVKPTWKKVRILDNLNFSGGYNFIADSLKMNPVSANFSTNILKKFNIYGGAGFDPYDRNSLGQRIDTYLWDSKDQLLRLTSANLTVTWNLKSKTKTGSKVPEPPEEEDEYYVPSSMRGQTDFTIPWTLNLSYSTNIFRNFDQATQQDTTSLASGFLFNGDFAVAKKWKVGFNSGYDVVNRDFTTTQINLYWDLHCWEFRVDWTPTGIRKSVELTLNIKSALLKDLKHTQPFRYGDLRF